ncbi:MAG TPA: hypothetical protein DCO68_09385, partial [Methylophilaceae bacterium]|nr:hypothetical protein [Methylophilaceae bacterium]
MSSQTLADLQKQWRAEDIAIGSPNAATNPLDNLLPNIGSLFSTTKTSSANASGSSNSGNLPFSPFVNKGTSTNNSND